MKPLERFWDWWKQDKRYITLCKALFLALLPVLCCIVSLAMEGRHIGEVYLPSSEWNDELFYYKQVESIVKFGFPQGYYGFNESHGLVLSFAAWSPVLVLPWVLWGFLFGWNLMSPVICNILLMTVASFLFGWLVKPGRRQMAALTLLFCLYTPFVRYMLSGMPEIICISHLIVFYGLAVNYQRKESVGKLAALFGIAGLLTLMRPYMLLFLLLPVYFWILAARRKGKIWQGIFGSCGVSGAILFSYAMIKHFFGAEYFHPLFFTDWITTFFTAGFGEGVHNLFSTLYWKGKDFHAHTVQGLRTGLASGAFFVGFLATMAVLLVQSIRDVFKLRSMRQEAASPKKGRQIEQGSSTAAEKSISSEERQTRRDMVRIQLVTEAHLLFSFIGMLFALILMYKLTEGSKHLLTFMAVGVFVVGIMDTRAYKKAVFLGAVFAYLYSYKAVEPYDYQVPYAEASRQIQMAEWKAYFADGLEITEDNIPNYDNVVIWVFNEQNAAGETMKWQLLYALPEGFGISCCQKEYILENFDSLNSRYIVAANGGEVDKRCRETGKMELCRDEDIVLYGRY